VSEKKDLTSLDNLRPDAEDASAESSSATATDAPPALEGLEDLLQPMSPTSAGQEASFTFSPDPQADLSGATNAAFGDDALASLPPIDPEVRKLAEGDSSADLPAPPLAETPIGAAIESNLKSSGDETSRLGTLKDYSERLAPGSQPISAAHPYSLLIEGPLETHEREALLQILDRENLGIREVELEPQFAAGRILIPRISEYAGVLIVQTLRGSAARMRLGPSEKIYASKETLDEEPLIYPPGADTEILVNESETAEANRVILTTDATVPGQETLDALGVIHASTNLKSSHVAKAQDPHFQEAIDRLKHQLRSQARHRGANALVSFKYDLHPLEGQTVYKLVVQGTAVRVAERPADLSPEQ
jgi:uncharacterized protein YbjQ (UPF0145 family)